MKSYITKKPASDFIFNDIKCVNFRNLSMSEAELIRRWRNDETVRKWMYADQIITRRKHFDFIRRIKYDPKNFWWLVYAAILPIGVINLTRCDFNNRNALLGVYATPDLLGAGKILICVLKKIAFEEMKLHSLRLEVLSTNEKALAFYRKHGFKYEGRLKEFVLRDGKWIDVITMVIFGE